MFWELETLSRSSQGRFSLFSSTTFLWSLSVLLCCVQTFNFCITLMIVISKRIIKTCLSGRTAGARCPFAKLYGAALLHPRSENPDARHVFRCLVRHDVTSHLVTEVRHAGIALISRFTWMNKLQLIVSAFICYRPGVCAMKRHVEFKLAHLYLCSSIATALP